MARRAVIWGLTVYLPVALPDRRHPWDWGSAGAAVTAPGQDVRSQDSIVPVVLTVLNLTERAVKCFWINYDGDAELYATMQPGEQWTVDTYQTHPWKFIDADNGQLVQEYYVQGHGSQVLRLMDEEGSSLDAVETMDEPATASELQQEQQAPASEQQQQEPAQQVEVQSLDGFDGLGNEQEDYLPGKVTQVGLDNLGGVVLLEAEGTDTQVPIFVDLAEASSLLLASGIEQRRPSTIAAWSSTLQASGVGVERVVLSRLVRDTFYSRIILKLPSGQLKSIDSRPGDSLALALQMKAPVFVSKLVLKEVAQDRSQFDLEQHLEDSQMSLAGAPATDPLGKSLQLKDALLGVIGIERSAKSAL